MNTSEQQIYIQKREIILKILEDLIGKWELADGLHALISITEDSPELLDSTEKILIEASKLASDMTTKAKMEQGIEMMQKIRESEEKERKEEQNELQLFQLDSNLTF